MIFSSCEKENEATNELEIDFVNAEISTRSSTAPACGNIIKNSSFENGTQSQGAFLNDLVTSWKCFKGSGDLVGPLWSWPNLQNWSNYTFSSNWAFLCTGNSPTHSEAIKQDINVVSGVEYCLSFDYSSTSWPNSQNGSLILGVGIGDYADPAQCGNDNLPLPICNGAVFCEEVAVSSALEYPNAVNYTTTFTATNDADAIVFWTDNNTFDVQGSGVFVDNVELRCEYKNLKGVEAVSLNNDCRFTFNPQFIVDPSPTSNLTYTWFFGDGNGVLNSTTQNPSHSYQTAGVYAVKLIIKDENGCCAEFDLMVSCSECQGFICHEGDAQFPSNAVGHYQCTTGFNYIDPNTGAPSTLTFNSSCYQADLDCIALEMELALNGMGFTNVQIFSEDPMEEIQCYKAGIGLTKGIFVYGDVEVLSMFGSNKGFDGWTTCNTDPLTFPVITGDPFNPCN